MNKGIFDDEDLKKEIAEIEKGINWNVCYVNQDGEVYDENDNNIKSIDINKFEELKFNLKERQRLRKEVEKIIDEIPISLKGRNNRHYVIEELKSRLGLGQEKKE